MKQVSKILIIVSLIFTIIGSTFAFWNWQATTSEKTEVTFTVASDFSCAADGGGNITGGDVTLFPCECTNSKYAIKREIKVTSTVNTSLPIYMDLWLDINELGTGLSNSDNFRYALTTSADSCEGPIASGTFKGLTTGDKIKLLINKTYSTTTTDTYYLWVWLDKEETSSDTMGQVVSLSLNGSCTDQIEITPDVTDGLIPVTLSDDGTITTISKTDDNWYNYNQKKWANAVLVSETNRSIYQDSTNVTIPESDILAYYVWIPRYKYKIWTTGTSSTGSEQEIDIIFESIYEISTGTQVGEYVTHPAFWWDSDSDGIREEGEELSGIWVGKFELTGTEELPTVKPNTSSLRSPKVSVQFKNILKLSGGTLDNGITTFSGSTTYGLGSEVNSHMLKNSEWGAVAYLSHSKYGINEEVRINNNKNFLTGCGALTVDAGASSSCGIAYGSGVTEYPQSTTGNITGIFDMSGGAWEYVMGVFANSNGTLWSGNSLSVNSGFNGLVSSSGISYTEGILFPESSYYNAYPSSTSSINGLTACNGGYCYGHAISETSGWYNDTAKFPSSNYPWFRRGGGYDHTDGAGIFYFDAAYGSGYSSGSDFGARAGLIIF